MRDRLWVKNLVLLLVIGGVIAWLDQSTKRWASAALATSAHPIPVHVTAPTPIEEAIAARFEISVDSANEIVTAGNVKLLAEQPFKDMDAQSYPVGVPGTERELYVFIHGKDHAPRRVYFFHRFLMHKWLRVLFPDMETVELMDKINDEVSHWTYRSVVGELVGFATDEEIQRAFEKGEVYGGKGAKTMKSGATLSPDRIALVDRRTIPVIDGFLKYTYAENPGAAWSFMADASASTRFWFFTVVASIAIVLLFFLGLFQTPESGIAIYAYSSILGGAVGNLLDRLNTNFVIDFIDMYWQTHHWPTYNVADIGITVGVTLLILEQLFFAPPEGGGAE